MSDYNYDEDVDGYIEDDNGCEGMEEEDDFEIQLENDFYTADGKQEINQKNNNIKQEEKQTDPQGAILIFQGIIEREESKDIQQRKWTFKSLLQIIILSVKINQVQQLIQNISQILKNMEGVSKNDATEAITQIIETIMNLQENDTRQKIFEIILDYLKHKQMIQLWYNASLKLCKIFFESQDKNNLNLQKLLEEIKQSCRHPDGSDDFKKSEYLLEVYSLEIQILIQKKQITKLKDIYSRTKKHQSTISDPKIMGIIKETNGKMLMFEKNYHDAALELLESFKNYQEVGNPQAKVVLKYVVLASILSGSSINPFDNREAKVYKEDREIIAMQNLRYAYENKDINMFNKIINDRYSHIMDDEFMKQFTNQLKKVISLEKIIKIINPYERIKIKYIGKQLNIEENIVENYLQELILDNKIQGNINSVEGYYENALYKKNILDKTKEDAINKWINTIQV
ncbi:hypothetical protein IMG5_182910 [Ichthyophthirius multifiliis]|uniref:PCI domain-containing protein n=1 Tax=Ichthyophthirius multifiliis TaxID=5932 RepID=G0R330_ICHMU|nr:hypothetical protein IMG5_182910 [Ichthyophthirius multifiliis]EGR28106.1 hypothetical protein IMG5_182910 [Ichthyophthirius multifiliis]|eukprot:XP_004027451.1 hypothetical protein IMG5_182910 [Ichthyophthirius multifiliis]